MMPLGERLKNSWNAFLGRDPTEEKLEWTYSGGSSFQPSRTRYNFVNAKSIVTTIYNQIAVDCAAINIRHVKLNEKKQYSETIEDSLNECLSLSANIDQTGQMLMQQAVMSMFDEGVIAIVPIDTDYDPNSKSESYKIYSLRVGKIVQWFPYHVRVRCFRESTQQYEELLVEKRNTVIVENPFYAIMNEPNSTLQRLKRTINVMERINNSANPGKMDLIIQLPYLTRSNIKKREAEDRRRSLEEQLTDSQYGVGYIDASEKVIQLNRSLENNLWAQIGDLQTELYNQMGFSQKIFDGTASETESLNYYNRTIDPILSAFATEMTRKWLSRTAITQGQAIQYFRDPFKLVPVNNIAEIADKFTRNEIMTSNEIRSVIGLIPSTDPKADELRNSNLNHPDEKLETVKETIDVKKD